MNTPSPTDELDRRVSALLDAADAAPDPLADGEVEDVLHALRERLHLDVVFVAEFVEGQRVFRFVDRADDAPPIEPGSGHELEASFCQRVVDGRLPGFIPDVAQLGPDADVPPIPFAIGTHLGTPVMLDDGRTFGTLCCFSLAPVPLRQEQDMATLRQCARLVARKLEQAAAQGLGDTPPSRRANTAAPYTSPVWKLNGAWDLSAEARQAWLDS